MGGRKDDDTARVTWSPDGTTGGSDDRPTEPGAPNPLSVDDDERYEVSSEIGEGGMGRVLAVRDGRLGREVAYKELAGRDFGTRGADRFAREVWLTAQLEHPGIVPVYDAGKRADGTSYYTMRYVHGRSLKTALSDATTLADRLALLGHFEDVCQAMAYAHSRGVIHRDLKPANVMLGAFGETQILDWGLARPVDDEDLVSEEPTQPFPGANDDTMVGTVMGTPAYMSPEQAHGRPVDERSDVWNLGVMLYEILSGKRPFKGSSATDVLMAVREGTFESVDRVCPDAPAELAAVVARALAEAPEDRYPSAKELRSDLSNYLTGRQVAAYAYSPGELLVRLVQPYRAPLAVGAVLLAALAVLGVDSYNRVKTGRDRARDAERVSRTAEQVAKHHLNEALVEKARAAAETGAVPEAEVVAAHALMAGENPEARGVLAALGLKGHPVSAASPIPFTDTCVGLSVSTDGKRAVCATGEKVIAYEFGRESPLWSVAVAGRSVRMAGAHRTVAVLDNTGVTFIDASGPTVGETVPFDPPRNPYFVALSNTARFLAIRSNDELLILDRETGTEFDTVDVCNTRTTVSEVAFSADDRSVVAACVGGSVHLASTSNWAFEPLRQFTEEVSALSFSADGRALAIGGIHGLVVALDLETEAEAEATYQGLETGVRQIVWSPNGATLAASADDWRVVLWDVDSARQLGRLPTIQRGAMAMAFVDNSTLNAAGKHLRTWSLPDFWAPVVFDGGSGLSSAELSPDGQFIATAHGDGDLMVWDRVSGELLAEHRWEETVVKRAAFSPDGKWLAASSAKGGLIKVFSTASWEEVASPGGDSSFSRVAFTAESSHVFGVDYAYHMHAWSVADWGEAHFDDTVKWHDIYIPPGRQLATADDANGRIYRVEGGAGFGFTPIAEIGVDALSYAITGDQSLIAASPRGPSVSLYRPPDTEAFGEVKVDDLVLHTLLSPDGRYLVTTHIDRAVRVWSVSSRSLRASLRGHRDRVVYATFDASGETLLTASWDGTARLWDMRALDQHATELVSTREEDWGLDLATAIANPTR